MRTDRSEGSMPAGGLVAIALAVAAVVGLAVGAVWGLSGTRSTSGAASTSSSTPVPPSPSPTASPSTDSAPPVTPSASVTPSTSVVPVPTGSAPPAPATTTTSADGWRLGPWRITNAGTLGVDTTARNTTTGTRSADLVLYVYIGGQLIATTTAHVADVPAGGTVPVHFAGTDPWKPGQKVLLLQTA